MTINLFENDVIEISKFKNFFKNEIDLSTLKEHLKDFWDKKSLFFDTDKYQKDQKILDFSNNNFVKVNNYIGFVTFGDISINILPKILKSNDEVNDNLIMNFHNNLFFWLSFSQNFNFPFYKSKISIDNINSPLDGIVELFVSYVNFTLSRKPLYQYVNRSDIGSTIKGKINFSSYIRSSLPKGQLQNIPYDLDSFEMDNLMNQVIKFTLKRIKNISKSDYILDLTNKVLYLLSNVTDLIILDNFFDKIHLSYLNREYILIRDLARMIISNKSFGSSNNLINGFSFLLPSEMVFEGFLTGVFKKYLTPEFKLYSQGLGNFTGDWYQQNQFLSKAIRLKEDLIIEKDNKRYVIDFKYKEINNHTIQSQTETFIDRNDINQVVNYSRINNSKINFLIYPLTHPYQLEETEISLNFKLNGDLVKIYIVKFPFFFLETKHSDKICKIILFMEKFKSQLSIN